MSLMGTLMILKKKVFNIVEESIRKRLIRVRLTESQIASRNQSSTINLTGSLVPFENQYEKKWRVIYLSLFKKKSKRIRILKCHQRNFTASPFQRQSKILILDLLKKVYLENLIVKTSIVFLRAREEREFPLTEQPNLELQRHSSKSKVNQLLKRLKRSIWALQL